MCLAGGEREPHRQTVGIDHRMYLAGQCRPEYSRPYVASGLPQQPRQLGDVDRDPPRLVFRQQLGRRAPGRSSSKSCGLRILRREWTLCSSEAKECT